MAITEWYVGKTGTDDLAAGRGESAGNPWLTPEYALDTGIPNTGQGAGGDRINIADGTYTLTKALSSCTYFGSYATGSSKPFSFNGAGSSNTTLNGDGSYAIYDSGVYDYISFIDLELTNTGSNVILRGDDYFSVVRCKLHNTTSNWIDCDDYCSIMCNECYNSNGTYGIVAYNASCVVGNYLHDTTHGPSGRYIDIFSDGTTIGNIIQINSSSSAVAIYGSLRMNALNNSIHANASTGQGIYYFSLGGNIANNLIEGFSGVGGCGISIYQLLKHHLIVNNAVYNCTSPYDGYYTDGTAWAYADDNETLSASPFTSAATGDFTPVDTGNVKEGGWPNFAVPFGSQKSYPWKGAIQPQATGGGGGVQLLGLRAS